MSHAQLYCNLLNNGTLQYSTLLQMLQLNHDVIEDDPDYQVFQLADGSKLGIDLHQQTFTVLEG